MSTPYPGNTHWPADFQGSTLTGSYVGLDGVPVAGTITLVAPIEVLLDFANDKVIVPRSLGITLDANGSFSILVPATDDPDISPRNWTYTIHENFQGGRVYPVRALQGQTVDVTTQAPVPDALGNPIVRGPRGIDGVLQNVEVDGHLGTITEASDSDITALVLKPDHNLAELTDPAAALINLGIIGDIITHDAAEFDLAGAGAAASADAATVAAALTAFKAGLTGVGTDVVADWNAIAAAGLYVGDSAANGPAAHVYVGFAFERTDVAGGITVLAVRTTTGDNPEIWLRNGSGGVWQAWHQMSGPPVWTNIPVLGAYSDPPTAQYAKVGGELILRGIIQRNGGGTIAAGPLTPLTAALPASCRPASAAFGLGALVADGGFNKICNLIIGSDGIIYVSLATAVPGVWLDGISIQVP